MTLPELVLYLVIGGLSGAIARAITGSTPWFYVSALLTFLGAILGTSVAHLMHLQGLLAIDVAGHPLPILWSIGGGSSLLCGALPRRC
jgi:hypothetical protein